MKKQTQTTPQRVEIGLGYACNNNCVFCSEFYNRHGQGSSGLSAKLDTEQVKLKLKRLRSSGADHLTFLGGEPTIRKDFLELVEFARSLGFKTIYLTTNGRRFADKAFAKAAVEAGLTNLNVSLHGPTAKVHDTITQRQGAFEEVVAGLKNLRSLGVRFDLTSVVCKQNLNVLKELFAFQHSWNPGRIFWSFVRPVGAAYENFEAVVPQLAEFQQAILSVLKEATRLRAKFTIGNVPLCLLSGYVGFADELYWRNDTVGVLREIEKFLSYQGGTLTKKPYLVSFDHYKVKPRVCATCKYRGVCPGLFKEYYERRGYEGLTPIEGKPVGSFAELRLSWLAD